jgi:hypothetical protein
MRVPVSADGSLTQFGGERSVALQASDFVGDLEQNIDFTHPDVRSMHIA